MIESIRAQKETGVIVVPPYVDVIWVPAGTEVRFSEYDISQKIPEKEVFEKAFKEKR